MRFFGHKLTLVAFISLVVIALILGGAVLAPWIAPHHEATIIGDVWARPSVQAPLGTDYLGRDMLSRLLYGGRLTIGLASLSTVIAFVVGVGLGIAAAAAPRWLDTMLSRLIDLLMAIPQLILALVVITVLGTSLPILIGTIALLDSTRLFRVSRAVAFNIVALEYTEAARLRGEGIWWIIRREVLPNAVPPLIAELGYRFCSAFLFIASLSFLGLGVQPPNADWGSMVRDNASAIMLGGYAPMIPATAIGLLTISVSFVIDWFVSIHGRSYKENA
jgi:peptide/nickel transport system permease protein